MRRRAVFDWLVPMVLSLAVVAIVFAVVFAMLVSFQATLSNTSLAWYAINNITAGLSNIVQQFGTLGTVIGYSLILGAIGLIGYGGYMLYGKAKGGRGGR